MAEQILFISQSMFASQMISEPLIQQQDEKKGTFWSCLWHKAGEKEDFLSLKFDHFKGGKRKKVTHLPLNKTLTWNAVASADLFKQPLYEQAEASGRIGCNIRLENCCL